MQTRTGGQVLRPTRPAEDGGLLARVQRLEQLLAPERLILGLDERFREAAPGTWPECVRVVQEHLTVKVGGPR